MPITPTSSQQAPLDDSYRPLGAGGADAFAEAADGSGLSEKNQKLLEKTTAIVHKRINTPWYSPGPHWAPLFISSLFSFGALVFPALTMDDKDDPVIRDVGIGPVPFAIAAFMANAAQIAMAGGRTFERDFRLIKSVATELYQNPRKAIKDFFQQLFDHPFRTAASVFRTPLTWYIASQVSAMQKSLALQVSWLQSDFMLNYTQVAFMSMYRAAIDARLDELHWPSLTSRTIVSNEVEKLRQLFHDVLSFNSQLAQDHMLPGETQSRPQQLFKAIQGNNITGLLSKILMAEKKHISEFSREMRVWIASIFPIFFVGLYCMSNSGSYIATINNTTQSALSRYASVIGDIFFGLLMSIEAGGILAKLYGNFKTALFTKEAVMVVISLGLSLLTVGSTLAPNRKAGLPEYIVLLGIAGTVFDNLFFLAELLTKLVRSYDLNINTEKNHDKHQKVVVATFYEELNNQLNDLSDEDFLYFLSNLLQHDNKFFHLYSYEFDNSLPWAKRLQTTDTLRALRQPTERALQVIDRSGQYGVNRNWIEMGGSLFAMTLIAPNLSSNLSSSAGLFFSYIAPLIAVPVGTTAISLLNRHLNPVRTPEQYGPEARKMKESPPSAITPALTNYIPKFALYMSICLFTKLGVVIPLRWILENVFQLPPDQVEQMSNIGTTLIDMGVAGGLTNRMAMGFR